MIPFCVTCDVDHTGILIVRQFPFKWNYMMSLKSGVQVIGKYLRIVKHLLSNKKKFVVSQNRVCARYKQISLNWLFLSNVVVFVAAFLLNFL